MARRLETTVGVGAILLLLGLAGCGQSRQQLALERMLDACDGMCGALESVRDLESAREANRKLGRSVDDLDRAFEEATADGKPSDAVVAPYRDRIQAFEPRMRRAAKHLEEIVRADRDVAMALVPSLLKLRQVGSRMQAFAAPPR